MTKKWKKRVLLTFYFIFIQTPVFIGLGLLISFHFNRGIYTEYVRAHDKIGEYYEFGKIGDNGADVDKAIEWYKKAGWLGNRRSQYNLGLIYYAARYGVKDNMQALKWFLLAADSGYKRANHFIGQIYMEDGPQQNFEKAIKYFTISSEFGNRDSQFALGELYRKGLGTEKDYQKAIKYYQDSSDQGRRIASFHLGMMYYMDEYGINNYFEAIKLLKMSYYNDFLVAAYHLGKIHSDERYEYNNIFEAIEWYEKAAKLEGLKEDSYYQLGNLYAEFDQKKSLESYVLAAENGNYRSSEKLGRVFFNGEFDKKNELNSLIWFLISKKQGNKKVDENIGNAKLQLNEEQIKTAYVSANNFIREFK